jgi:hypothetical protein
LQQQQHQQGGNSPRGRGAATGEERAAVAAEQQGQLRRQGSLQNDIVPMPKALCSERSGGVPVAAVATGPVEVVVGAAAVQEGAVQSSSGSSKSPLPSPRVAGAQAPGSPRMR